MMECSYAFLGMFVGALVVFVPMLAHSEREWACARMRFLREGFYNGQEQALKFPNRRRLLCTPIGRI